MLPAIRRCLAAIGRKSWSLYVVGRGATPALDVLHTALRKFFTVHRHRAPFKIECQWPPVGVTRARPGANVYHGVDPAYRLQYAAFFSLSKQKFGLFVQESYEHRLLVTGTMPSSAYCFPVRCRRPALEIEGRSNRAEITRARRAVNVHHALVGMSLWHKIATLLPSTPMLDHIVHESYMQRFPRTFNMLSITCFLQ